jgi:hypothetical protein
MICTRPPLGILCVVYLIKYLRIEYENSLQVGQITLRLRTIIIIFEDFHVIIPVMNIGNEGEL